MAKYKVGDRVKIRQWDDMQKEFGLDGLVNIPCKCTFLTSMKHLCGRTATIEIIDGAYIELNFDDKSGDINWLYSTDMIEPIEQEFHVYDTVKHKKYGIGTIVDSKNLLNKIKVDFDNWNEDFPHEDNNEVLCYVDDLTLIKAYSPK